MAGELESLKDAGRENLLFSLFLSLSFLKTKIKDDPADGVKYLLK